MFRMFQAALTTLRPLRRLLPLTLAAAAIAGLSACGGSTSRVESFHPQRMVVFGDELSVIGNGSSAALLGFTEPAGAKYFINALDSSTGALDCSNNAVWVQSLSTHYGLPLGPCKDASATQLGWIAAQAGARVADVVVQTQAFQDTAMDADTLVTVVAGMHDVLDAYDAFSAGGKTRADALADVSAAGTRLGQLVTSLNTSSEGPRILYATLPNLGLSPLAVKEEAAYPGEGRASLLSDLTVQFNESLRLAVTNDGRFYGLVNGESLMASMADTDNLKAYSLSNVDTAACDASKYDSATLALPQRYQVLGCTTATLLDAAAASSTAYLWADDIHPGPNWQGRFGSAAVSRARNNPF